MKEKVRLISYASLYSFSFVIAYIYFLNFHQEYYGFEINVITDYYIIFTFLISLIPIYFYNGYKNISSGISIFIYILLYVPTIFTFYFSLKSENHQEIYVNLIFCFSMCLFFLVDKINLKPISIKQTILPIHVLVFTLLLTLYVLFIYRNNLRIVSFEDVYDLRRENDVYGKSIVEIYLTAWLYNVMLPLCLTFGIILKNKISFIIGMVGCFVMYISTGSKAALLLPIIYIGIYFLIRNNYKQIFKNSLKYLSLIILLLTQIEFSFFTSILLSRTIGNGGLMTYKYFDFFSNNPNTHFSHINIINKITNNYPYKDSMVGQVVGREYWGSTMNANANFWATDGLASLGLYGVPIISIIFCFFLIFLNSITRKQNQLFLLLCCLPFILNITNTSFFSSLLTGGGFLIVIFFMTQKTKYKLT